MKISTAIAYGTAWIATSVAIGFAIKYMVFMGVVISGKH